jgi:hypothetical protein
MGRPQLTGAGVQLVATLGEAIVQVQHLHTLVERMALAVKTQQPTAPFGQQFRRSASPIVGKLKGQFGLVADQLSTLILIATRSGSDKRKVAALREGIGQIKLQLDVAMSRVFKQHAQETEESAEE